MKTSLALFLAAALLAPAACRAAGIVVLRHGEAEHNVGKFFNGNPKSKAYRAVHLTEKGRGQAETAAKRLRGEGLDDAAVTAVYVSPLPRTRETAGIVARALGLARKKTRVEPRIIETNMGRYEGRPHAEFPWDPLDHAHAAEYGGESHADVLARVKPLLEEILRSCDARTSVLLVTHGDPAAAIIEFLTGAESDPGKVVGMIKTGESRSISWDEIRAAHPSACAGR